MSSRTTCSGASFHTGNGVRQESTLRTWIALVLVFLLAFLGTAQPTASAQSQSSKVATILEAKKLALEQQLEERARRLIQGSEAGQYLLYVKVEIDRARILKTFSKEASKQKNVRFKSLPSMASGEDVTDAFLKDLTLESLFGYVKKINVVLTLDSGLADEQSNAIKTALEGALQLNPKRGDTFTLQKAKMSSSNMQAKLEQSAKDAQAAKDQLSKLEGNIRELEIKKKEFGDQAAKLDEKSTRLAEQVSKLQEELKTEKEKSNDFRKKLDDTQEADSTQLGKIKKQLRGLELPLSIIPVGLLGLVIVFLLGLLFVRSQGKSSRNIAEGLAALAGAVQKVAQAQSQAAKGASGGGGQGSNGRDTIEAVKATDNQQGPPADSQALELAHREAAVTWELLKKFPYPMLSALKDWLAEPEGMLRFLLFSEAIGAENARVLWTRFPRSELEALSPLLYKPIVKAQAYATVIQLYRLVSTEVHAKPAFFSQLELDFLVTLTDEEVASLFSSVPIDTAACGLLFVSPRRAAALLKLIQNHASGAILEKMKELSNLSADEAKKHAAVLKRDKPPGADKKGFDLADHMVLLLESAESELRAAVSKLLDSDEALGAKVKARVFIFDDVLGLDDDTLLELVSDFEPEQIAALVFSLGQAQVNRILGLFGTKAGFGINEELGRIAQKPALQRKAKRESALLQNALTRQVKAMINQGLLDRSDTKQSGRQGQQGARGKANQGNGQQGNGQQGNGQQGNGQQGNGQQGKGGRRAS